jgi:hypothetical protein
MRSSKNRKLKSSILSKPFFKDLCHITNLNSLPIYAENSFSNSFLLSLKNYQPYTTELGYESFDESYENSKYLNYVYYLNYKNLLNYNKNIVHPISYANVLDTFRADYEENYMFTDNISNLNTMVYSNENLLNLDNEIRISNPLKLRSTAKNAIVQYNAIQKVFRSRFDEGRSNARLQDFSNSFNKHPFLTDSKPSYESMLSKNKEDFFRVNLYNQYNKLNFSNFYTFMNATNIYFMDLPFLVSTKSDPTRYLWFD